MQFADACVSPVHAQSSTVASVIRQNVFFQRIRAYPPKDLPEPDLWQKKWRRRWLHST